MTSVFSLLLFSLSSLKGVWKTYLCITNIKPSLWRQCAAHRYAWIQQLCSIPFETRIPCCPFEGKEKEFFYFLYSLLFSFESVLETDLWNFLYNYNKMIPASHHRCGSITTGAAWHGEIDIPHLQKVNFHSGAFLHSCAINAAPGQKLRLDTFITCSIWILRYGSCSAEPSAGLPIGCTRLQSRYYRTELDYSAIKRQNFCARAAKYSNFGDRVASREWDSAIDRKRTGDPSRWPQWLITW